MRKLVLAFILPLFLTTNLVAQNPQKTGNIANKEQAVITMVATPDGKMLLTGGDDNKIKIWDLETNKEVYAFTNNNDWVTSIAFSSPEGDNRRFMASGCKDGSINIYDFDKRNLYYQAKTSSKTIYDLLFLEQYSLLVGVSGDGIVSFIDLDSKVAQELKISENQLLSVAYLESSGSLVIGDAEGNIKFIDPVSRSVEKVIADRQDFIRSVAVMNDQIISVGDDKSIKVRSSTGDLQNEALKAHKKWIQILEPVGDDEHFITGGHDGVISLWSLEGLTKKVEVKESGTFVSGVTFNEDLTKMYTVGYGGSGISIWDMTGFDLKKVREIAPASVMVASSRSSSTSGETNSALAKGIHVVQPYYAKGDMFFLLEDEAKVRGFVNVEGGVKEFKIINKKNNDSFRISIEDNKSFEHITKISFLDNEFNLVLTTTQGITYESTIKFHRFFDKQDPANLAKLSRNGRDYALIFATNDYKELTDLTNPVFDANTIANELESNYGFEVEKLINPPLDEIKLKIKDYTKRMFAEEDQLFIFIAGHGEYDSFFKEGYIVATDSKLDDEARSSYLPHSTLRTYINNIPCRHIMLTMDVCFGGTFDPIIAKRGNEGLESAARKVQIVKRKLNYLTRLYVTSGGKEYVPDGRAGHHSPFARKFLESLRTYGGSDEILTTKDIFSNLELLTPEPRFGDFGDNEPGSDFIFIYK